MASHATSPTTFDELDPHDAGHHGQHGSHVIVGPFTLRAVLMALLVFTVLTVAQARLEVYLAGAFNTEFPRWVNVAFCMTIAVVKALLVMGFFMQLKFDNPINTVVMGVTFFVLALFLGFTSLDMTTRGEVASYKGGYVVPGGTDTLVVEARKRWELEWGPEKFEKQREAILSAHAHAHTEPLLGHDPTLPHELAGPSGAFDVAKPRDETPHAPPAQKH